MLKLKVSDFVKDHKAIQKFQSNKLGNALKLFANKGDLVSSIQTILRAGI